MLELEAPTIDGASSLDGAALVEVGQLSATGWQLPDGLAYAEWESYGRTLNQMSRSINFWIGDWLLYGENHYGETYAQMMSALEWDYGRLATAKWVAGRVQFSLRNETLSWSHHREVAILEPAAQEEWLTDAASHGWTVRELRAHLQLAALEPVANDGAEPKNGDREQPREVTVGAASPTGDGSPDGTNSLLVRVVRERAPGPVFDAAQRLLSTPMWDLKRCDVTLVANFVLQGGRERKRPHE